MAFLYVRWLLGFSFDLLVPMFSASDQTDSTGKPTSDVVQSLRAARQSHENIFVRVATQQSH